ncbi:aldo/keto reductase [Streptosporangium sp. NPDC051022]|uniref:aldo/keto reductase n=1 Tax=Streptosporangium sp. NPDC051022 TaxID=3155752 RepID=UPI00344097DB
MTVHVEFDDSKISRLGIGCSNFGKRCDADAAADVVRTALDMGVNFFDVADVYGNGTAESLLARGLGGRRDEAIIATKFGHATKEPREPHERGGHPRNVIASAEASLRALRTDYIDLYQIHEPDPTVPIAETLGALRTLVEQGKVRWAGCSNFSLDQLTEATDAADGLGFEGFRTVQNEYSLLVRDAENDVLPYCRDNGMGFIPYFPLASGVLTGKYRKDQRVPSGTRVARMKPDKLFRFFTPAALDLVEKLAEFGAEHSHDVLVLAFGLHMAEPAVLSVIAGAMSGDQVRTNAAAVEAAAKLDDDAVAFVRGLPW